VLVEGGQDQALLLAQVNMARVDEVRAFLPVFVDRRPGCYIF